MAKALLDSDDDIEYSQDIIKNNQPTVIEDNLNEAGSDDSLNYKLIDRLSRKPKSVDLDQRLRAIAEDYNKRQYLAYLGRIVLVLA